MKLKKMLALLATGAMAVSAIAGCSSGSDTTPAGSAASNTAAAGNTEAGSQAGGAETTPVEMETITVWSNAAHESEIRKKQIDAFNEGEGKELGIFIDYQIYGTKYSDTIKIAAQAGEAPELFSADSKWIVDFVDAGYIVPIEDLPGSEQLIENFREYCSTESQIFNDKIYTLPNSLTTFGLVINKDLFAKAGLTEADYPETWEDVRECARKITEACNGTAYGFGLSSTLWTITSFYMSGAAENTGHNGYDRVNRTFCFSDFNPMIEAIDNIVADGSVIPGYEALDGDQVRAQFAAGNIGMMGTASFDCSVYTEQFPATCDWQILPVPKFEDGPRKYKRIGTPVNLLVAGPKAIETPEKAAKVEKVLELFYSDECTGEMYSEGIYIPMRPEAVAAAPKEPDLKGWSDFAEFDEIYIPKSPEKLLNIEGTVFREAIMNMWMTKELDDVDAVMADLDKRYNDALAKVDPELVAEYDLPEGLSPEKGK